MDQQRYKKLRQLVKRLNKERKRQAAKIDILCNDMIAEQRSFINNLRSISFAANFYESIVGLSQLDELFDTACRVIKEELPDVNIAFFLRQADSFELHLYRNDNPIELDGHQFESLFTDEVVSEICRANKLCSLENLLGFGLMVNPQVLKELSAFTIPLGRRGLSLGFILAWCVSPRRLTADQLQNISAITHGLSHAIGACHTAYQQIN